MPEVHIIGEICAAEDFPYSQLYAHWKVVADDNNWSVLAGHAEGYTQVDASKGGLGSSRRFSAVWNHPLDLHYATSSVQGWPKLVVEVWHLDSLNRQEIAGYGVCHIPTAPGEHGPLRVVTWRPYYSPSGRMAAFFLGGYPQLKDSEILAASFNRSKMQTESMGIVSVSFQIVTHGFEKHGVSLA
eukprot:CAMPEP_0113946460 /NCGR_PEP_ID=MMETSP1339-20121228/57627_1 /TAXON_ID=94617 /ORGANISM="Fibrocapsa japonica" /LENGTH=184 /DNA_ID=CAMNT_0000952547 /DNA_START=103 /DNA_END=657 /DNA_ORIENTATION=- /assembly_acc=CAM_ASM_000762